MDRGSQLDEEDEEDDEEEEEERRGEEEQATDIKSNNPHLAGGEKHGGLIHTPDPFWSWSRGQKSPGDGLQLGFSSPAITSWV